MKKYKLSDFGIVHHRHNDTLVYHNVTYSPTVIFKRDAYAPGKPVSVCPAGPSLVKGEHSRDHWILTMHSTEFVLSSPNARLDVITFLQEFPKLEWFRYQT